jgi:uncharacterized protein (DUF1501 family)
MPRHSLHKACDDFHRTSSVLSRRQLIGRSLAAGLTIYGGAKFTPLERMLEAAEAHAAAAPNAPVLVSVFLPGGCDLLDTLVPLDSIGRYADARPGLRIEDVPKLVSGLGLHPSLAEGVGGGIAGLFARNQVGFMPGIDYSNPDMSHFHSRHFWETGLITHRQGPGWLGRYLDRAGSPDNPLQAIAMDWSLSPLLRSASAPVAAVSSPDDAQFHIPGVWGDAYDRAMAGWGEVAAARPAAAGPSAAFGAARMAKDVADRLKPYTTDDGVDPLSGTIAYPEDSQFGERLKHLAGLIELPLGVRVATVQADGDFDTHDNQKEGLAASLKEVSEGLAAFQADLVARGIADRVLTFVWSEFGRRVEQNDSGTDHGAGGIAWVMGNRAKAGILCDYPDLGRLDDHGNLAVTLDFRRVYASLLEQWLGHEAESVIPNAKAFGRLELVK